MDKLSSEAVAVLAYLLPGFVATAVFYALTPLPKPDAFNRIVHALIFTALSQAFLQLFDLTHEIQHSIVWSIPTAIVIALLVALALNHDAFHRVLRKVRITKETAYPSEWFSTFARHPGQYIVLHLRGSRRLYGWAEEWPSDPTSGHFRIADCEWLTAEGGSQPVANVEVMLIPNSEVEMVEFMTDAKQPERKS